MGAPGSRRVDVLLDETVRAVRRTEPRYATWAGILGALAATDRELYRTKIGPYEQRQLELTGDVL